MGPDLSSVGTTLSSERIVEELLWPNRQVKEGYTVAQVVTDSGIVRQGFLRKTRDSEAKGDVLLEDLVTRRLITIQKDNVEEQVETGSPMPAGLTAILSDDQLSDLVKYLTELGKAKK